MATFLIVAGCTIAGILLGAGVLHLIPRLGQVGQRVSDALCRAPLLDWVVTYFTTAPMIVGPIVAGWRGFAGGVVGQVTGLILWTLLHEAAHTEVRRGPRILKVSNKILGPVRNMAAVYLTAIVTPIFWVIRVVQVAIYPLLAALTGFPRYRDADWVNVSRHKFSGLVGHDLIWCLYCDWMTGVWSLGSEMLRNVESFWCPIRFRSDKKCANCAVDFPDLENGWVAAESNMSEVTATLQRVYGDAPQGARSWFGHPARLTIKGKPIEEREPVSTA